MTSARKRRPAILLAVSIVAMVSFGFVLAGSATTLAHAYDGRAGTTATLPPSPPRAETPRNNALASPLSASAHVYDVPSHRARMSALGTLGFFAPQTRLPSVI